MLLKAEPVDTPDPLKFSMVLEPDTLLQNMNLQVYEQPYPISKAITKYKRKILHCLFQNCLLNQLTKYEISMILDWQNRNNCSGNWVSGSDGDQNSWTLPAVLTL
ncbi:hypothetical protein V8G54_024987 [Vigna mungo]|uniref:Uncharacterized protein n=1 Tax=Vigna mungo TaxID=3915 RepID=A0AAQ3N7S0_VIGMU